MMGCGDGVMGHDDIDQRVHSLRTHARSDWTSGQIGLSSPEAIEGSGDEVCMGIQYVIAFFEKSE